MGLTCSLLGHAYGDPETEHEREERGQEVVDVTREVRECARCGDRTVVSENTEVRTTQAADPDPPAGGGAASAAVTGVEGTPGADSDAEEDADGDAGIILEDDGSVPEDAERAPGEWPSADDTRLEDQPGDDAADFESADPDEEDAEVLDAEAAGAEEAAAPEADEEDAETDPTPDAGTAIPDAEGSATEGPQGAAAQAAPGDPVADVTGREWPDEGPDETEAAVGEGTGIATAETEEATDAAETVFVCPSCEFRETAQGSSLRSGDICPECQRGYLAERTRN